MRRGVGQWVALRNDQLLDVQYIHKIRCQHETQPNLVSSTNQQHGDSKT